MLRNYFCSMPRRSQWRARGPTRRRMHSIILLQNESGDV